MKTIVKSKGTEIVIDNRGPVMVIGESINPTRRKRLVQALTHLYDNAIKFTKTGTITCRAIPLPDETAVQVSITDTGVGIALESHPKVFASFEQVGDTLTDKPMGTGLGLPICRAIIEHLGGQIWFESAVGVGSTFYFTIPCAD